MVDDFFLVSSEGFRYGEPRRCSFVRRLHDKRRKDLMLVRIDPPIIGQEFGLGDRDVDLIILASRLEGYTLFPVSSWPCPVYCGRIVKEGPNEKGFIDGRSYEIIDWADIWRTEEEAMKHRIAK